jgi:glycosyltransferase involved in cell wall biosynthesis
LTRPNLKLVDLKRGQYSVVRIIARLNVGGPAQHVLHLTRELRDSHPTLLITGDPEPDETEFEELSEGVPVLRVRELGRRIRFAQDVIAFVKIFRILRKVRPDIVHTHTAKAGAIGRIAAFLAGVPIRVHTFHGHVFEGYFGRPMASAVVWAERGLAHITSCIIAISQTQARDLTERFRICRESKVRTIPLGLSLQRFRKIAGTSAEFRREVQAETSFLVVSVGRLAPIKNHNLLLSAAALLNDTDTNIKFALIGGGSEDAKLKARAIELGVDDKVVFTGWKIDLREVYAAADLIVLTSLNEGTPVCLIEALAAGVPVVAADVGGVRDLLLNGTYGTLFPSGNARALSAAIRAAALSGLPHNRESGSEYAIQEYSLERLLHDVRRLYLDLCERAGLRARRELRQPSYQT